MPELNLDKYEQTIFLAALRRIVAWTLVVSISGMVLTPGDSLGAVIGWTIFGALVSTFYFLMVRFISFSNQHSQLKDKYGHEYLLRLDELRQHGSLYRSLFPTYGYVDIERGLELNGKLQ